jgi:hypothetical protein
MMHIRLVLFSIILSMSVPFSIQAQASANEADSEIFNHFSVVFFSYVTLNEFLKPEKSKHWTADHTESFAEYYFGSKENFQTAMTSMFHFFDSYPTAGPKKPAREHYADVLAHLIAQGKISEPKGTACAISYQSNYFGCILSNLHALSENTDSGLEALKQCAKIATTDFNKCTSDQ